MHYVTQRYTVNVVFPIRPERSQVKSHGVKCVKCMLEVRVHAVSLAPKSGEKDQSLGRFFCVNSF
jgi:hypothetical protein